MAGWQAVASGGAQTRRWQNVPAAMLTFSRLGNRLENQIDAAAPLRRSSREHQRPARIVNADDVRHAIESGLD